MSCRLQSNYSSTVTLHGGPVVLRPVRATSCYSRFNGRFPRFSLCFLPPLVPEQNLCRDNWQRLYFTGRWPSCHPTNRVNHWRNLRPLNPATDPALSSLHAPLYSWGWGCWSLSNSSTLIVTNTGVCSSSSHTYLLCMLLPMCLKLSSVMLSQFAFICSHIYLIFMFANGVWLPKFSANAQHKT